MDKRSLSLWGWLKRLFGKPKSEKTKKIEKQRFKRTLLEESYRMYPTPLSDRLPRSFTNRPGVRKAQVNLKKAGYREDAKPE